MEFEEEVRLLLKGIHELRSQMLEACNKNTPTKELFGLQMRFLNLSDCLTKLLWSRYGLRSYDR